MPLPRPRPRHSTVVAYLALFVAMSGTAYAATGGTFTLGHHNDEGTASGLHNTRTGPALRLSTHGKNTPNLSVSNRARIDNLNADAVDGLTATQIQTRAGLHQLPSHWVPVSARPNFALANGTALRAALADASARVIVLDSGRYDMGNRPLVVPDGVSVIGAGAGSSTVVTTASVGMGVDSSLDALSIDATVSAKDVAVISVSNTSDSAGATRLSDVDVSASSTAPGLVGLLATESTVLADDVSLHLLASHSSSTGLSSDDGDIVFRDGYIASDALGGGGGGDGWLYPQIDDTRFSSVTATSLSAADTDFCSGDYSDDTNNFMTIPDGKC